MKNRINTLLTALTLFVGFSGEASAVPNQPSYVVVNQATADGTAVTTAPNPTGVSTVNDGAGGFLPNGFTSSFNSANLASNVSNGSVVAQTVAVTSQSTAYGFSTSGSPVSATATPNIAGSFTPIGSSAGHNVTDYANQANVISTASFSGQGSTGWSQVQAQGTLNSSLTPSGFTNNANLIGSAASFVSGNQNVTGAVTSILSTVSVVAVNH
jgi:hypothetical protein